MKNFSIEIAIIIFQMVLIVFIELRNWLERRNLMDRLMSRTYDEYASHENLRESLTAKVEKEPKKNQTISL
tara:strand:+ start:986 stop:1198 length:213 start_codon:yes stop_codon:yes gene_type:complete